MKPISQNTILYNLVFFLPISLFPLLYFPYIWWWKTPFATFAVRQLYDTKYRFLQLMTTGNNSILLFWICVTVIVMICALVISIWRMRPWYVIPVYLAVVFSLCGIFSLSFYTLIVR